MKTNGRWFWIAAVLAIAVAFVAPLSIRTDYYFYLSFIVLQYVVLATAWNILGGYAGYVNFGTGAFFGVGAYASLVLIQAMGAPLLVQVVGGAIVSGLLGIGAGLLTLRLRGIFFSIATIAAAIVIETFIVNWRYVGGAAGVQILRPPVSGLFESYTHLMFFAMAALAVVSIAIARYVEISWIGRGLRAIRDSEVAAECSGVPTLRLKLLACALSGALMGAAGALLPFYANFVEPISTFSLNYSILALAMAVIGGMSHWSGPVVGAVLLAVGQQFAVVISAEFHLLLTGLLLVVFVVVAPDGIVGLLARLGRGAPR